MTDTTTDKSSTIVITEKALNQIKQIMVENNIPEK